jgi:hypothetical protein
MFLRIDGDDDYYSRDRGSSFGGRHDYYGDNDERKRCTPQSFHDDHNWKRSEVW